MSRRVPIAIVGMACRYPDARSPQELFENALAQRQAFRKMPSERLNYADYFSSDRTDCDRVYSMQAAVIEGYEFDRHRFNISGSTYRSVDLAHWLALDIATAAIADAGFGDGADLPRQTTGVLVGNTLTGEFSRSNLLRTRWPYVRRTVEHELMREQWDATRRGEFLARLEELYKAPFPPGNEETLAGGLSNTIAGRICNYFDLKGGGYTVDGACASSLLAIAQSCSALASGDLDLALAGGVDLSLDPFELVGFARAGALAPEEMRVFDVRSGGFWPGEGCGFVALMRLDDALRQGRRIYAAIRGWGIGSDGAGGITRPEVEGQALCIRRAYDGLDYGPRDVGYFEAHGTGTAVGDATELRALSTVRRESGTSSGRAVVGSVKAIIGHTKAAAGVAGVIKTVMVLHHQTLPPTVGCKQPHEEITAEGSSLRTLRGPEVWPEDLPLRAGVSGFGFGGINCHLALDVATPSEKQLRQISTPGTSQDCELFLFDAEDVGALRLKVERVAAFAAKISRAELSDLASALASELHGDVVRAAVVAETPTALATGLGILREWFTDSAATRIDTARGVFLGVNSGKPRVAFLCPGQGSSISLDGGAVARRFASARELFAGAVSGSQDSPSVVQPAIVRASLAAIRVLAELGIQADVALGHSLGELTAMCWAGAFSETDALLLAATRGKLIAELSTSGGAMASIAASTVAVDALRNGEKVVIACHNGPRQTVISGPAGDVEIVVKRARARQLSSAVLRTTHAFHSSLVAPAGGPFRDAVAKIAPLRLKRRMISTITGDTLGDADQIPELLGRQMTSPVLFAEAARRAAPEVDLFIEVGSGEVLTRLMTELADTPTTSVQVGNDSLFGLLATIGAAFAIGVSIDSAALFRGQLIRSFSLDWKPKFFANPCEAAPVNDSAAGALTSGKRPAMEMPPMRAPAAPSAPESPLDALVSIIADLAELAPASIRAQSHLLRDLHLNSIKVAEIVAKACRRLGLPLPSAPTEMSTATVGQLAGALADQKRTGAAVPLSGDLPFPSGVDSWVRAFKVKWIERSLPLSRRIEWPANSAHGPWQVFASSEHSSEEGLVADLTAAAPIGGVILILPPAPSRDCVGLMLRAARAAIESATRFIIVHHGAGGAALAKTVFLESGRLAVTAVDVPVGHPRMAEWIYAEARAAEGFREVSYDTAGVRRVPIVEAVATSPSSSTMPLNPDDVLLVTGGGKGISAECALTLARQTGARLVILGRALEADDRDLAANLARFRKQGVRFSYQAADVTDAEAVCAAVRQAQSELGTVTAILHGAGINVPQLLMDLDEEGFQNTVRPKIDGLQNILNAIDTGQLRLLVTFGSVIARTGMRGEGDYAIANAWLSGMVDQYQSDHPACRCLNLEWSVWSGVGMGPRLGSITPLLAQGITPIPVESGVRALCDLLRDPSATGSLIVSGRFGNQPTLETVRPLPEFRFLKSARCFYPDVELVADVVISLATDPYLADHVFQGRCLLPGVIGLEMMAEAALAVGGWTIPPSLEDVRFDRPIEIPLTGEISLRLAALAREDGRVEVTIRTAATQFAVNHFTAFCRKGGAAVDPMDGAASLLAESPSHHLDPSTDLYDQILFHGPRFRRVLGYPLLRAKECVAEISADTRDNSIGDAPHLALGDPIRRDAAIHAIQACIPHLTVLPTAIRRLDVYETSGQACRVIAREAASDAAGFDYDLWVRSEDGRLLEHWQGLRLTIAADAKLPATLPVALLEPYLQRRVEVLMPGARLEIRLDSSKTRKWSEDHRPDGKPDSVGAILSSRTYFRGASLSCTSQLPVGIDAQPVEDRSPDDWAALLGPARFGLVKLMSESRPEPLAHAAARVWSAGECLTKLSTPSDAPLTMGHTHADGWTIIESGRTIICTYIAPVRELETDLCFAIGTGTATPKSFDFPQSVGFDEINRMGTVNFTTYFHWQARAREAFLRRFAPGVMHDLHGGAILVTTGASCDYKSDVDADHPVIVRMTLGDLGAYTVAMEFDYLQVIGGQERVVAAGRQTIASMSRVGGALVAIALPPALRDALADFASNGRNALQDLKGSCILSP